MIGSIAVWTTIFAAASLCGSPGGIARKTFFEEPVPAKGHLIYQNNFARPSDVEDWVMEGPGVVEFNDGWMEMYSPEEAYHHVFWCPQDFPDRFIAEWDAQNLNTDYGLCIVFFAAKGINGEDIFDPSLPERDGDFTWYIKDRLRSYHISYYANTPKKPDRGRANLRKNNQFNLVQEGEEGIPTRSTAIHRLTLVKDGPHIRLFVDGRKVIDWTDTKDNEPRPYYKEGKFGLRQMKWTRFRYRNLRVWEIVDRREQLEAMAELPLIHSKDRLWATPAFDLTARHNPPSLLWPTVSGEGVSYAVRMSRNPEFPADESIQVDDLAWAIYNPHRTLAAGRWYWQHRANGGDWSEIHSFLISGDSVPWNPPSAEALLNSVPRYHPRLLVDKPSIQTFRASARGTREAERIVALADHVIGREPPSESEGFREFGADSEAKIDKLEKDASKAIGQEVFTVVGRLCKAYVVTGNPRYADDAIRWALEAASWDPAGVTRINDFGDSRIMLSMARVYDTFYARLDESQRAALLEAIRARANHFYRSFINSKEGRLLSNHVWQHVLHYFFDTSLAMIGEIEEADQWLTYTYELFLARAPVLGGSDGGWTAGMSYFRMNMATLIDIPERIKRYTGFDFIRHTPWYQENTYYFLYGFPPGSAGTGFADNSHDLPEPRGDYLAYADALSRLAGNPHAAWYRDQVVRSANDLKPHVLDYMRPSRVSEDAVDMHLGDTDMLQWFRLKYLYDLPSVQPRSPEDLPMARVFRDVGLVTMHAKPLDTPAAENLMVAMRSSPFGTYSHMLADNNTFNIVYGGDRMFYHTGYKVAMSAPHRLQYYKHTKSHNGILIEGKGQPYSPEAYGWIENFLNGESLSYAVGNASNAYESVSEEFDAGMKVFKRHLLLLRPDILVVYDELEAVKPVEWSYLLHAYQPIEADVEKHTITTTNPAGRVIVRLYSGEAMDWQVTDEYEVPAENWRRIRNKEGELINYPDNAWHFAAKTEQAPATRFLAIMQFRPSGDMEPYDFNDLRRIDENTFRLGKWKIHAEMDATQPAVLRVTNTLDRVAFSTSGKTIELDGMRFEGKSEISAKLIERDVFHESRPGIPEQAVEAIRYFNQ